MTTYSSFDLARWLDGEHIGPEQRWTSVATLDDASVSDVSFCQDASAIASAAGVVLTERPDRSRTCVVVKDAKLAFIRLLERLFPVEHGGFIAPSASVDPSAFVHATATIHPGAVIMANCFIGANTVIFPNVVLYPETQIGEDCRIHAGSVIGADGFSYHPTSNGPIKVPQIGRVRIESGVEVGANTTIDRAFLTDTLIGRNSKLDNLVHVGHNCTLGEAVIIAAQVGLSGSVRVEDGSIMGGQAGVVEHTTIGAQARIGAQSGVSRHVAPGQTVLGTPAEPAMKMKRIYAALRQSVPDDDPR